MMNNKIFYGVIGLVAILVLAFLGGKYYRNVPVGGTTSLTQPGVTAYDEIATGDASVHYRKLSIVSGESTAFVRNDSPFTRYVDMGALIMSGNSTATPY